ncbi:MAG: prolipoprotein diacylglyceryl transferase [Chloroflexi bacterium]|nr:prolipoprotein diacylglyceryl transferase [Chloroflexota bacterium]
MIAFTLDPVMLRLGPLVLTWHGLFTALGVAAGSWLALRIARQRGLSEDAVLAILPWGLLGGILGARLLHVLDNWQFYVSEPWRIPLVNEGGIALFGAIIGGSLAGYIAGRRLGADTGSIADLSALGLLLGQAIGRVGDLINGEHLSKAASLPWGTMYLHADSPGSRIPVHPAVGYEMVWDLVVLGALFALRNRLAIPGMTYWSYLLLYSTGRFLISFLRLDPIQVLGLQMSQTVALLAAYVAVFALLRLVRQKAGA